MQLVQFTIGVTTKGPGTEAHGIESSERYWYVMLEKGECAAYHNKQKKVLPWDMDDSAGNTFGCCVSGTGELHLHHNEKDVGVAWEGLPTDQPLWGFVILRGYKVEANYVIAPKGEAVCVCQSACPVGH